MMIGFTAKATIVVANILAKRIRGRCSRIALDRDRSALAIGQSIALCPLSSLRDGLTVLARAVKSAPQFLCGSAFFVDTPGVIRRFAGLRSVSLLLLVDWMRFCRAPSIVARLLGRHRTWR
jgi:hypothetical protein